MKTEGEKIRDLIKKRGQCPDRIYKYFSFSNFSLESLVMGTIHFGSPLNFNDPYDCALIPNFEEPTEAELRKFREEFSKFPTLNNAAKELTLRLPKAALIEQLYNGARNAFDGLRSEFLKKNGVACFTCNHTDLLMWSHYADHHRGFCLGFDGRAEFADRLLPVKYEDNFPKLSLLEFLNDQDPTRLLDLFTTKSTVWSYEQEWRGIHSTAGTNFGYSRDDLQAIYFGPEMPEYQKILLAMIATKRNPNVELWTGERSTSAYEIEFQKTKFTPL